MPGSESFNAMVSYGGSSSSSAQARTDLEVLDFEREAMSGHRRNLPPQVVRRSAVEQLVQEERSKRRALAEKTRPQSREDGSSFDATRLVKEARDVEERLAERLAASGNVCGVETSPYKFSLFLGLSASAR